MIDVPQPKKIASIYVRVSTQEQRKGWFPDVQRNICFQQAEEYGYIVPDDMIFDEGISGDFWNRSAFSKLRQTVRERKITAVFMQYSDRISRKAWQQLREVYPEIPATLAALAPRPCLILSNGSPRMLEAAMASSGLAGQFTHLLSADLVKVYKPDPRVYALAPNVLGLRKEAIVFVSSNSFDVMGAKAYGFQVVWINRANAQADELPLEPDIVLSRLDELPQAFPTP